MFLFERALWTEKRAAQLSSFIHGPLMANFADTREMNVEGKKLSTIYMYYWKKKCYFECEMKLTKCVP